MDPTTQTETSKRIRFSEACRLYKYRDKFSIVTFGWGINANRSNLEALLEKVGANYGRFVKAPIAIDAEPANAVEACLTQPQADAIFDLLLPGYITAAAQLLDPGIFDALTPARQFVWVDMAYNMGVGPDGLGGFHGTIALLNDAQRAKNAGNMGAAHNGFVAVGDHMKSSSWYGQIGDRAKRDVAMMRAGVWCKYTGNGSDIAA